MLETCSSPRRISTTVFHPKNLEVVCLGTSAIVKHHESDQSWPSFVAYKAKTICLCQESSRFLNQLLVEKRYLCFWWKSKHLRDVKKRKDEVRNVQRDERTYGCNYGLKGSFEILTLKWPLNIKIEATDPTYLKFTIVTYPKT